MCRIRLNHDGAPLINPFPKLDAYLKVPQSSKGMQPRCEHERRWLVHQVRPLIKQEYGCNECVPA